MTVTDLTLDEVIRFMGGLGSEVNKISALEKINSMTLITVPKATINNLEKVRKWLFENVGEGYYTCYGYAGGNRKDKHWIIYGQYGSKILLTHEADATLLALLFS